jgi:hypothetical protein
LLIAFQEGNVPVQFALYEYVLDAIRTEPFHALGIIVPIVIRTRLPRPGHLQHKPATGGILLLWQFECRSCTVQAAW